jgi:Rhodopirellula transposase DDE domain
MNACGGYGRLRRARPTGGGHLAGGARQWRFQASHRCGIGANRKTKEGSSHPDRNAQFEYINAKATEFLKSSQPAISVDTNKKQQVGNYKNGGREWRPKGQPELVQVHDFGKQKDVPYGVYDLGQNAGWVSVGTDHDTSAFAVESIRRWWCMMGREAYPDARQLFITADSGGSNGVRVRFWKLELQKLADETGLEISVCHFPPGTSKWNLDRTSSVLLHNEELAWQARW